MNEIPGNNGINKSSSNSINNIGDNLTNTLSQNHEILTFKDFSDFENSPVLSAGVEFEPNYNFFVTDNLINDYSTMFNDSFVPHVVIDPEFPSFPSKKLNQGSNQTRFFQGIGTICFIQGFHEKMFKFEDKTKVSISSFKEIKLKAPNPSGSKVSSKFKIKEIQKESGKVKITYEIFLYSDIVEEKSICEAEIEVTYETPGNIQSSKIINNSNIPKKETNQKYETLFSFDDFNSFKKACEKENYLQEGKVLDPNNLVGFTVTNESINKFNEMFHIEGERKNGFLLSFFNGFVRRLFKFSDKTELLTPGFDKIDFFENPLGGEVTSTFEIMSKEYISLKDNEGKDYDTIRMKLKCTLYSNQKPLCVAERKMLYISPNGKFSSS